MSDVDAPRRGLAPRGSLVALAGIVASGVSGYATLVLVTRLVEPRAQPALAAAWTLVFLVGPAVFFPLEQALAGRLLRGAPAASATRVASVIAAGLVAVTLAAAPWVLEELLDGHTGLLASVLLSYAGYAVQHVVRARLVAAGRFDRYALVVGLDGALRLAGCAAVAVAGARSPEAFAIVLGVAPALAALPGRVAPERGTEGSAGLGGEVAQLLVGSLCAQVVLAGGPAVLKLVDGSGDRVPAYLVASSLTRIPLLLGQALLAPVLAGVAATLAPGAAPGAYASLLRRVALLVAGLGGVATVAFAALGPWVTRAVFGERYVVSRGVLAALSGCAVAFLLGQLLTQALVARHQGRAATIGWVCGLVAFGVALIAWPGTTGKVVGATACGCSVALLALAPPALARPGAGRPPG